MTPFPVVTLGGLTPQSVGDLLARNLYWMARWSDEIVNDVDLDLKKLIQLAYVHCLWFSTNVPDSLPQAVVLAINARMRIEGFDWPVADIPADVAAIKAESTVLHAFVRDNLPPEYKNFATRVINPDGTETEAPAVISPKPAAVQTRVATLRALFV